MYRWSADHGTQNVQASDEARLQFHQPDERLLEEDTIADGHAGNPEQMASRQELITLVQLALRDARRTDREVFILHAVEGFSQEEIAVITDHTAGGGARRPSARRASTCNAPCPSNFFSNRRRRSISITPEGAALRRPFPHDSINTHAGEPE